MAATYLLIAFIIIAIDLIHTYTITYIHTQLHNCVSSYILYKVYLELIVSQIFCDYLLRNAIGGF